MREPRKRQCPATTVYPYSISFSEFVRYCVVEKHPRDQPRWREPLFDVARALRLWCDEQTTNTDVFNALEAEINARHGGWMKALTIDAETAYSQFMALWSKIQYLPGETPIEQAVELARLYPFTTARHNKPRPTPKYNHFITVAGWLQHVMRDKPILLPCKKLAPILETDGNMISTWRKMAIEDGYLVEEKAFAYRKQGIGTRATEFRFVFTEEFERRRREAAEGKTKGPGR